MAIRGGHPTGREVCRLSCFALSYGCVRLTVCLQAVSECEGFGFVHRLLSQAVDGSEFVFFGHLARGDGVAEEEMGTEFCRVMLLFRQQQAQHRCKERKVQRHWMSCSQEAMCSLPYR